MLGCVADVTATESPSQLSPALIHKMWSSGADVSGTVPVATRPLRSGPPGPISSSPEVHFAPSAHATASPPAPFPVRVAFKHVFRGPVLSSAEDRRQGARMSGHEEP